MIQEVTLKVFIDRELKTILKPPPSQYTGLVGELRQVMKSANAEFTIKYRDKQDTEILIYSQSAYETALRLHANSVLQIYVEPRNPSFNRSSTLNDVSDGCTYEGQTLNGKRNGQGRIQFPSDVRYEGAFCDNRIEGEGVMTFPNGRVLRGRFVGGKLEGNGVIYSAEIGVRYEGEVRAGVPSGKGLMMWGNGDGYYGQFNMGKREGVGTMFLANGSWMEGDWVDDRFHGLNTLYYSDGSRYRGQFQQGVRSGQGVLTDAQGRAFEQTYENGVLSLLS